MRIAHMDGALFDLHGFVRCLPILHSPDQVGMQQIANHIE